MHSLLLRSSLLLTMATIATGCAEVRHAVQLEPAAATVIQDVTIIDGTGAPAVPHQDVVVVGDRVVAITNTGTPHEPPGRTPFVVVDGRGQTLLPGFCDAHVHIGGGGTVKGNRGFVTEENLERWLRMGITTAFDMASDGEVVRQYDDRVTEGTLASPRLFHTNFVITAVGGYPIGVADALMPYPAWLVRMVLPQVADADDIDRVLDDVEFVGVDYVKIMVDRMPAGEPIMSHVLLTQLIREARRRQHLVFVHAGHVDDATAAANAGATALAHLPWRGRFSPEQLKVLKDSGVAVVSTATMWENTEAILSKRFTPSALDEALVPKEIRTTIMTPPTDAVLVSVQQEMAEHADNRAFNLRALLAAGIPVVLGTDSSLAGTWPGSSHAAEQQTLLDAGMTPMQLIVAMTSGPARVVGGSFGTVAVGKRADIVLVDGDPLTNPTTLTRPTAIFLGGHRVTPTVDLPPLASMTATTAPTESPAIIVTPTPDDELR